MGGVPWVMAPTLAMLEPDFVLTSAVNRVSNRNKVENGLSPPQKPPQDLKQLATSEQPFLVGLYGFLPQHPQTRRAGNDSLPEVAGLLAPGLSTIETNSESQGKHMGH